MPDIVESNISSQVGYFIMSHYYHTVMVIVGHQMDVILKIQLNYYDALFTNALPKNSVGKTNPSELLNQLTIVQQKSISLIKTLTLADLESKLEPTPFLFYFANSKSCDIAP